MSNKTLSIISYITLIGWVVAFIKGKETPDPLVKYHLKQAFGIMIVSIILNVVFSIIAHIVPALSFLSLAGLAVFVFWIIGIINAANGVEKPVPVIGKMFEDKFSFIS
jgi:uncharacterized membrane protein